MTVHITSVALSFGADQVLDDVSAIVRPRDRIALVGRNGAGKTTLLRMVAGELDARAWRDLGHHRARASRCTTSARRWRRTPRWASTWAAARPPPSGSRRELRDLEERMAAGDTERAVMRRYDAAQREFERAGGYGWRSRLESVARGLGFSPEDLERPLRSFSGGELTRASLTRALAAEPDVLLLDEPTNHLDTDAIEWLEEHIDSLDAAVLFVSHDRWFLESVANGVLLIERGQGRFEKGTYSHFRRVEAERLAAQAGAYDRQQAELAHLQRFVDRFRYGTKSRQAQSKLKAMARIERVEKVSRTAVAAVRVPSARTQRPGGAGRRRADRRGRRPDAGKGRVVCDRAGPAGCADRAQRRRQDHPARDDPRKPREAEHGRVKLGHNVEVAYYSQQSLELPDAYRMIEVITAEGLTGPRARDLLGMFLFSGEDVEKPVSALSGGERRRLALARTVISGANLLVLDEPTNHLDIESREALEDALEAFPGTLLLVSHDRALIEAIATRTLAIEDGRLIAREGAFGAYASAHETAPAPAPRKPIACAGQAQGRRRLPPPSRATSKRPSQRAKRETSRLEREIAAMEEELGAIETRLSEPDAYEDPTTLAVDGRRHQELQQEIAYKYREWEKYASQV